MHAADDWLILRFTHSLKLSFESFFLSTDHYSLSTLQVSYRSPNHQTQPWEKQNENLEFTSPGSAIISNVFFCFHHPGLVT